MKLKLREEEEPGTLIELLAHFTDVAVFTLPKPPETAEEVDATKNFVGYVVLGYRLFDPNAIIDTVGVCLAARAFINRYREYPNLRPTIAYALKIRNWPQGPSELSAAQKRKLLDQKRKVPKKYRTIRNLPPEIFARVMVPKLVSEGVFTPGSLPEVSW